MNYYYVMALFAKVIETKIQEPRGRLTRLIKFTTGEARERDQALNPAATQ